MPYTLTITILEANFDSWLLGKISASEQHIYGLDQHERLLCHSSSFVGAELQQVAFDATVIHIRGLNNYNVSP